MLRSGKWFQEIGIQKIITNIKIYYLLSSFGHAFFHTWNLHNLKIWEICLKPQLKYLHCSCTGLKPTWASSALGFNEKMVIYIPGGSYFCLGFLRLRYMHKSCTVARQWVHHCAMSQTYHAHAEAKVIITLCRVYETGLMGFRHLNPFFIYKKAGVWMATSLFHFFPS